MRSRARLTYTDAARALLQEALAVNPANDDARYDYVKLLIGEGDLDAAQHALAPAMAQVPRSSDGKPDLTNKDVTSAMNYIDGLWKDGVIASGSFTMKEQDKVEEFTNGRVGMMIDALAQAAGVLDEPRYLAAPGGLAAHRCGPRRRL